MESQPQNPEFRINPENFHPCIIPQYIETYGNNTQGHINHDKRSPV